MDAALYQTNTTMKRTSFVLTYPNIGIPLAKFAMFIPLCGSLTSKKTSINNHPFLLLEIPHLKSPLTKQRICPTSPGLGVSTVQVQRHLGDGIVATR
jgi:hypothetical protein